MTIDLSEKEAEAYLEELQGILDRLRSQEKDLQACIRHLRRQSGEESHSPEENEIRIRGLEFDIGVTRDLIERYEQDIRDLGQCCWLRHCPFSHTTDGMTGGPAMP